MLLISNTATLLCIKKLLLFLCISADGHYAYAEGSSPAQPSMHAFLNSKLFPPNKGRFMIFWYHLFGTNIGKLSVQLQLQNGTSSILWEQSGDQGWNWLKATVNVTVDQSHSVSAT